MKPTPRQIAAFKAEVRRWADRIGVRATGIYVRQMKKRWASCSSSGRVSFSTLLLSEPLAAQREAIAHELVHLLVPNHGALFRATLAALLAHQRRRAGRVVDSQRAIPFRQ